MANIEEHIRKAMEEGKFKDLPGKGKRLNLDQNPFEDPEWRLANKVLRDAGFSLPWIETRREIENGLEAARKSLAIAWAHQQAMELALIENAKAQESLAAWQRALESFREKVEALNQRILVYNLETPSSQLQRPVINAEREINQITSSGPTGPS